MSHRAAILLAGSIIVGLFRPRGFWLPDCQLHSAYETSYAMMTIMIICMAIVAGAIVGSRDASNEASRLESSSETFLPQVETAMDRSRLGACC